MKFDTNSLTQTYIRHFTNLGDLVSKPLCGTGLHNSRFRVELVLVGLQLPESRSTESSFLKKPCSGRQLCITWHRRQNRKCARNLNLPCTFNREKRDSLQTTVCVRVGARTRKEPSITPSPQQTRPIQTNGPVISNMRIILLSFI